MEIPAIIPPPLALVPCARHTARSSSSKTAYFVARNVLVVTLLFALVTTLLSPCECTGQSSWAAASTATAPASSGTHVAESQRAVPEHQQQKQRKSWCFEAGCGRRSSYVEQGGARRFCVQHKNASHTQIYPSRTTSRRCQVGGCNKQPNFGPSGGKAAVCRTHKQPHHVNVNRPTCCVPGCTKWSLFGEEIPDDGEGREGLKGGGAAPAPAVPPRTATGIRRRRGRALFCLAHSSTHHVNVRANLCIYAACERSGIYGNVTEGYLCSLHRRFIQASRRCKHPEGCQRAAFFGSCKRRIPIYCVEHKAASHVNCMVRLCAFVEGCGRQPSFGEANETVGRYCKEHKEARHVDVKHDRCAYFGCTLLINPHLKPTASHTNGSNNVHARARAGRGRGPTGNGGGGGVGGGGAAVDKEKEQLGDNTAGGGGEREQVAYAEETKYLCTRHRQVMTRIRPPLRPTLVVKRKRRGGVTAVEDTAGEQA